MPEINLRLANVHNHDITKDTSSAFFVQHCVCVGQHYILLEFIEFRVFIYELRFSNVRYDFGHIQFTFYLRLNFVDRLNFPLFDDKII